MVISIDRTSGLFTPEMSDRINTKATDLYNNIQALEVPNKAFKEKVTAFKISTSYDIDQRCYSIGRTCILMFQVNSDIKPNNEGTFITFGTLPYSPVTDVIWLIDGKGIFQIVAGTNTIKYYPFSNAGKGYWVYTFFNI